MEFLLQVAIVMPNKPHQWYVRLGNQVRGPFTSPQLKSFADRGKIADSMEVRLGTSSRWSAARNVKGLFPSTALVAPAKAIETQVVQPPIPTSAPLVAETIGRMPCPMCGELILESAAKCRFCNEYLDGRPLQSVSQTPIVTQPPPSPSVNVQVVQQVRVGHYKRWSRLVAMLLSLFIPGLGQIYKGQPINGIVWFMVTAVGYLALILPGVLLHICCILGAGMGDPYR